MEHRERVELLSKLIENEPEYLRRFDEIRRYRPQLFGAEIQTQEQALLYKMAVENTFLYKARNSNIFLQNIGELVKLVNSNEIYRQIKPYIYFAVLSRKHKLMMTREHYSPNIPKIFDYQEYRIHKDNHKNFDTYQSYLELYAQLRESYDDEIDGEFTDYCMANTSNLCEWFFENCEPVDVIPMSLTQVADYMSNNIWLETEYGSIRNFIEANPMFEITCENILSNSDDWEIFTLAMQNGEDIMPYAERLYQMSVKSVPCPDKENALKYSRLLLYDYMEEYNRKLLVCAAKNFVNSK